MSTEYLAPGCYGKLPFWPEYLEVQVVHPSSRELKRWIHEGRHAAGLGADSPDEIAPKEKRRMRFAFGAPGSPEMVAGVIRPSADIGNKREFPFAVFAHFARRAWGRHYAMLPMALEPTWDALDDIWVSLAEVASQAAFREILQTARVPGPRDPSDVRGVYEGGLGRGAAWAAARGDGASVEALRANFAGLLKELKASPDNIRLELPVGADLDDAAFDASFWIDLLNRQFLFRRFEPLVFLDGAPTHADRRAFLVFGPAKPEDYGWVMGLGAAAARVHRPAHAPGSAAPAAPGASPTYGELAGTRFVA